MFQWWDKMVIIRKMFFNIGSEQLELEKLFLCYTFFHFPWKKKNFTYSSIFVKKETTKAIEATATTMSRIEGITSFHIVFVATTEVRRRRKRIFSSNEISCRFMRIFQIILRCKFYLWCFLWIFHEIKTIGMMTMFVMEWNEWIRESREWEKKTLKLWWENEEMRKWKKNVEHNVYKQNELTEACTKSCWCEEWKKKVCQELWNLELDLDIGIYTRSLRLR